MVGRMQWTALLMLVGCTNGGGRELRQGMPYAQPAPPFNAVETAPHTTGQPGYVGPVERLPRSPHKRVLPQTPETRREDGLWAVRRPSDDVPPFATLDKIHLPLPADGTMAYVNKCSKEMDLALNLVDVGAKARLRLEHNQRVCVAARLWAACMETLAARMQGVDVDPVVARQFTTSRAAATDHARSRCEIVDTTPVMDELVARTVTTWTKLTHGR